MFEMYELFVRNYDWLSRITKAAGCCLAGIAAVWRCYSTLNGMNSIYALVMCIFFAFFMTGIAVSVMQSNREYQ